MFLKIKLSTNQRNKQVSIILQKIIIFIFVKEKFYSKIQTYKNSKIFKSLNLSNDGEKKIIMAKIL